MNYGFIRTACASPDVSVANCTKNADSIISLIKEAEKNHTALLVLPELAVTGYTCGDLFLQPLLLKNAVNSLFRIASAAKTVTVVVGTPVAHNGVLYNTAAVLHHKEIVGLVPKTYIPNYSEFYEARHFTSAKTIFKNQTITLSNGHKTAEVPFGTDLLFTDTDNHEISLAIEICEDLWAVTPPSAQHALHGATIIANCSASNEIIGKAQYRKTLVQSHSARITGAYLYADAGTGESTTDVVFAAHNLIAENGSILAESLPFQSEHGLIIYDIDVDRLTQERRRTTSFAQCMRTNLEKNITPSAYRKIPVIFKKYKKDEQLYRNIEPLPFIPKDSAERNERCREVIALQTGGLVKRLKHTKAKNAVIGLSGGLDSTLAFLVTVNAFKQLSLDVSGLIAVTMPCFGTTDRTYNNAVQLAHAQHATLREIPIMEAVMLHFADIGHDNSVHDITYENSQARERTQVLMDIANQVNGIVIGTGDLSELALGWATYNGDHMSMYGVNSSIPKTLVKHLVRWFADTAGTVNTADISAVLYDILDTPVSPELLPPNDGKISQKTEDIVGPYELHDFFLYHFLRWGVPPEKMLFLAEKAFAGTYSRTIILKWLRIFIRRFFSQQFKRSCLPDGAKVGTINLSPRGDWRMPSDAESAEWLSQIDFLK